MSTQTTALDDGERLKELYHGLGLSIRDIADRLNTTRGKVAYSLSKHGIGHRESNLGLGDKPWRDGEKLRELYHEHELSTSQIAEVLDVAQSTIIKWMNRNGIERRAVKEAHDIKDEHPASGPREETPDEVTDAEWLRERYASESMSCLEIADLLGCSKTCVENWVHKHGIEMRPGPRKGEDSPNYGTEIPLLQDGDKLRELYWDKRLSTTEIAARAGTTAATVHRWLVRNEIETRSASEAVLSGPDHPNWKGGGSCYYGPHWHRKRRAAIDRDGGACVRCGVNQSQHKQRRGESLHVHHLRPFRTFDDHEEANQLDNLVTVCRQCHNALEKVANAGLVPVFDGGGGDE